MPDISDAPYLRSAFSHFATGVTIVTTTSRQNVAVGLTVNSFASISLSPPYICWSLSGTSSNLTLFRESKHFAVHILKRQQENLARTFAIRNQNKFSDISTQPGLSGIPLIADVLACMECRNVQQYDGGDHIIFIGRVERFSSSEGEPLLFWKGQYHSLTVQS